MCTSISLETDETPIQNLEQDICKIFLIRSRRLALVKLPLLLVDITLWTVISAGTSGGWIGCYVCCDGEKSSDPVKTIKERYEKGENDEFLKPIIVVARRPV